MKSKKSNLLILSEVTILKNIKAENIRNAKKGKSCCKLNLDDITRNAGVIKAIATDVNERKVLLESLFVMKYIDRLARTIK
ncbi:MAG: hypothetical protein AB7U98_03515 [Candidatus Nitrosocosmicus sp.]